MQSLRDPGWWRPSQSSSPGKRQTGGSCLLFSVSTAFQGHVCLSKMRRPLLVYHWPDLDSQSGCSCLELERKGQEEIDEPEYYPPHFLIPLFLLTRIFNQCAPIEGLAAARWVRLNRNLIQNFLGLLFPSEGTELE